MKRIAPQQEPLKILFYGIPGSTKTRTAASACLDPRTAPVLYLEAGGNIISIRDYNPMPDVIHIEALEDFNPIYEWLINGQPECPFQEKMGLTPGYKTVVIDQITDIQRMTMNKVSGNTGTMFSPGTIPQNMQIQHFNSTLAHMVKFSSLFFGIPNMHVIITCQEREDKDETSGLISYKPLLWGQSAGEVPGYAYLVARLVHRARILANAQLRIAFSDLPENVTSVALTMPSSKYIAKDQYGMRDAEGNLLSFIVDPSIPKILDLVYGPGQGPKSAG